MPQRGFAGVQQKIAIPETKGDHIVVLRHQIRLPDTQNVLFVPMQLVAYHAITEVQVSILTFDPADGIGRMLVSAGKSDGFLLGYAGRASIFRLLTS